MSNKTSSDLATAVLRELNAIDASETPDTVDTDYVVEIYTSKYEELGDRELCYWPLDEIPGVVFITLRDLIINEVRGTFGEPQSPEDKLTRETAILRRLREHMQRRSSGLPVRATYF
jgi:hypothetical protein